MIRNSNILRQAQDERVLDYSQFPLVLSLSKHPRRRSRI